MTAANETTPDLRKLLSTTTDALEEMLGLLEDGSSRPEVRAGWKAFEAAEEYLCAPVPPVQPGVGLTDANRGEIWDAINDFARAAHGLDWAARQRSIDAVDLLLDRALLGASLPAPVVGPDEQAIRDERERCWRNLMNDVEFYFREGTGEHPSTREEEIERIWTRVDAFRSATPAPSQPETKGASVHELKTDPVHFEDVKACRKTFELRRDDRDFRVGDTLILREFDRATQAYSGRIEMRMIGHILRGTEHLAPGYCALSLALLTADVSSGAPKLACPMRTQGNPCGPSRLNKERCQFCGGRLVSDAPAEPAPVNAAAMELAGHHVGLCATPGCGHDWPTHETDTNAMTGACEAYRCRCNRFTSPAAATPIAAPAEPAKEAVTQSTDSAHERNWVDSAKAPHPHDGVFNSSCRECAYPAAPAEPAPGKPAWAEALDSTHPMEAEIDALMDECATPKEAAPAPAPLTLEEIDAKYPDGEAASCPPGYRKWIEWTTPPFYPSPRYRWLLRRPDGTWERGVTDGPREPIAIITMAELDREMAWLNGEPATAPTPPEGPATLTEDARFRRVALETMREVVEAAPKHVVGVWMPSLDAMLRAIDSMQTPRDADGRK